MGPPLKEDAVPSIFGHAPPKKVRKTSIDRASRQTKREVSFWYECHAPVSRLIEET